MALFAQYETDLAQALDGEGPAEERAAQAEEVLQAMDIEVRGLEADERKAARTKIKAGRARVQQLRREALGVGAGAGGGGASGAARMASATTASVRPCSLTCCMPACVGRRRCGTPSLQSSHRRGCAMATVMTAAVGGMARWRAWRPICKAKRA